MKKYTKPTIVEFGNAVDLTKGCGGWGCEVYMNNQSYCDTGHSCYDCYPGQEKYTC